MPYKDKEQKRQNDIARRQRLKELGYCSSCLARMPEEGSKTCSVCMARHNSERMKKIRENRRMLDLCANCGKQLDADDKSTCKLCRARSKEWKAESKLFKEGT